MGVRVLMPAREQHHVHAARPQQRRAAQRRYRDSECHQMLRLGSPVFEMASAIQARALALSAIRSARAGALSLSPPAPMYCCANLPSDRQFSELSYFTFRSRTSATQRLAAPFIWPAIDSSGDVSDEHPGASNARDTSRTMRALYTIATPRHVEDVAAPEVVVLGRRPLLLT